MTWNSEPATARVRGLALVDTSAHPQTFCLAGVSTGGIVALEIVRLAPERIGQDPSGHAHQRIVLEGVSDPHGNPTQSCDGPGPDGRVATLVRDQHEVLHS